jgi:hypothetical protein
MRLSETDYKRRISIARKEWIESMEALPPEEMKYLDRLLTAAIRKGRETRQQWQSK